MRIELKGLVPEKVMITCCKEAGVVFESASGDFGTSMIEIKSTGAVEVNGSADVTPELIGQALINWANTFSRVMNK